jgi:ABC-type branched-subunit amino acid transport system ATPase component
MIETDQLTKRYGELTAVDALSFKVAPGEVLGFLGPNGAGKSTTMKILSGFLDPQLGQVPPAYAASTSRRTRSTPSARSATCRRARRATVK